jgi:hypothetical protein
VCKPSSCRCNFRGFIGWNLDTGCGCSAYPGNNHCSRHRMALLTHWFSPFSRTSQFQTLEADNCANPRSAPHHGSRVQTLYCSTAHVTSLALLESGLALWKISSFCTIHAADQCTTDNVLHGSFGRWHSQDIQR